MGTPKGIVLLLHAARKAKVSHRVIHHDRIETRLGTTSLGHDLLRWVAQFCPREKYKGETLFVVFEGM